MMSPLLPTGPLPLLDTPQAVVDARGISKQYRIFNQPLDRLREALSPFGTRYHTEFYALRDVSFSVRPGESLAIIGRNGSGKSTLLKLITGVVTPTQGALAVQGRIAALLELGAGFNPEYTGVENVFLNGTLQGYTRREIETKLPDILAFADIGDFAWRACKSYSSGMFARLAFAAMIHFEPDLLIVDEALAVGDVFFQQKCFRWMKERMANVTKLLVSHDMVSVAQLATRAIVLDRGRLAFDGDPLKAIEYYTRALHTELFALQRGPSRPPAPADGPVSVVDFQCASQDALGGAREVDITGYCVSVNEGPAEVVRPGDLMRIWIRFTAPRRVEHLIVGVSVADKYGQGIFGVNSLGSGHGPLVVENPGARVASLQFEWPEIKAGHYFITLGLGEGVEELDHVVQCWAHNIADVEVLPLRALHGIFNVQMREISLTNGC